MTGFARIVVGVDGHEGGADALALAGMLQSAAGGELIALHVYPFDRSVSLDRADEYEEGLRDELIGRVTDQVRAAGLDARAGVVADASAARALHDAVEREGADLVVVGASHREQPYRTLLGDTCAATLHAAPCAVAVAPRGYADGSRRLRRIGVGFDGSEESRAALALGRRLAMASGADLRVWTIVAPPPPAWPVAAYAGWPDYEAAAIRAGNQMLAAARAELGEDVDAEVVIGDAGAELADRTRDLDLLLLGSRSYGPVRRVLLGSTSTRVVRAATGPVLVLPRVRSAAGAPAPRPHIVAS